MSIRVGLRHMRRDFAMYCPALYIVCRLFSAYNLCSSVPNENILVSNLTSTYFLCIEQKEYLTSSFESTYSLETAPT